MFFLKNLKFLKIKVKIWGPRCIFEGGRKEHEKNIHSKLPILDPILLTIVNPIFIIFVLIRFFH